MKNLFTIVFVLSALIGGVAYADSTSTPAIVCASLSDIGNLAGALGCAGASSTLDLSPQVTLSLDPSALAATITVPEIIASSTVSENVPIDSPIPLPIQACSLMVKKIVQGGTALASDFMIHVLQNGSDIADSPQPGSESGTLYTNIDAGTYAVSETGGPSGYTATFGGDCDQNGVVHLSIDQNAVCTVTNVFATSTATSTSGGGTSTSTPPGGGGGGGSSGGGGGGGNGGGGSSGGGGSGSGGGGGPVPPPAGGGPIGIGGGTVVTELSGISAVASTPQSEEEAATVPGIPNTGVDGTSAWVFLVLSGCVLLTGTLVLGRSEFH